MAALRVPREEVPLLLCETGLAAAATAAASAASAVLVSTSMDSVSTAMLDSPVRKGHLNVAWLCVYCVYVGLARTMCI